MDNFPDGGVRGGIDALSSTAAVDKAKDRASPPLFLIGKAVFLIEISMGLAVLARFLPEKFAPVAVSLVTATRLPLILIRSVASLMLTDGMLTSDVKIVID